jgi:hypothetical protein
MVERALEAAEHHITTVERRIAQQLTLNAQYAVLGFDKTEARALLRFMQANLNTARACRRALLRKRGVRP